MPPHIPYSSTLSIAACRQVCLIGQVEQTASAVIELSIVTWALADGLRVEPILMDSGNHISPSMLRQVASKSAENITRYFPSRIAYALAIRQLRRLVGLME